MEQVRGHRSIERRRTRDNDLVRHAGFAVEIDIVDAGRRHRQAAADVEIRHNARAARHDGSRIGDVAGTEGQPRDGKEHDTLGAGEAVYTSAHIDRAYDETDGGKTDVV